MLYNIYIDEFRRMIGMGSGIKDKNLKAFKVKAISPSPYHRLREDFIKCNEGHEWEIDPDSKIKMIGAATLKINKNKEIALSAFNFEDYSFYLDTEFMIDLLLNYNTREFMFFPYRIKAAFGSFEIRDSQHLISFYQSVASHRRKVNLDSLRLIDSLGSMSLEELYDIIKD